MLPVTEQNWHIITPPCVKLWALYKPNIIIIIIITTKQERNLRHFLTVP